MGRFSKRYEGAILALLRHRPSGREVLVGATHLFWDPRWAGVKVLQAAVLCQQVAAFLARAERAGAGAGRAAGEVPVVIGGDFNSLWRKYVPDVFDPQVWG